MGKIIREFNWSETALGSPDKWPGSLTSTLSLCLNSAFPMLVFWGPEMITFYNDAFRPSLGIEGKHPGIGKKGEEMWADIWHIINPLFEKVKATGEPIWFEDQLVPFYRNGKTEDIYWTFSYSPIYNEEGRIHGIFVTCTETTEKVRQAKHLEENREHLRNIILKAPVAMCLLQGPEYVVEIANNKILEIWGKTADEVLSKPVFTGLPEAKGQGFEELLERVYTKGETYTAFGLPTQLPRNNELKTVYLNFVYEPHWDVEGNIIGVIAVAAEVTEQVVTQLKLEESEHQVRSIVESAPFPIGVYHGKEMKIALANQSILDVWGKGNDVVGKLYAEVLPELDNQEIFQQLDHVFTTGIPFHAKNRRVDLMVDGAMKIFYFNYSFTPLYDSNGNIYGVMNTAADVTDLNLAKQQIEESETRFRLLADSMPQFIWSADEKGNLNYFNQAILNYSGLSLSELSGKGWLEIVHPDEREESFKLWQNSVREGNDFIYHHRFKNKNGEYKWQLSRAVPQKDSEGNIQMWIGTSTDIHDHKLFEEELSNLVKERTLELERSKEQIEKSAERLHAVFNNAQSGMFTFSPVKNEAGEVVDFRFVITNPNYASYVGQTPEMLNGTLGSKWFPTYLTNGVFDTYKKTYLTGESQRLDIHYKDDGLDIFIDVVSAKVGDEVLVTFTDHSPLKRAQLQLEKYIEELKRSNASLEEFAYAASHDMKEPIRKIHFFTDRIKASLSERFNDVETRYFNRMELAARRMGYLIDDLLSYSQLSVVKKDFEPVDLNHVVQLVLNDLELEIEEKNAIVDVQKLCIVSGHSRQLQQVFQNLITNAMKFMKEGTSPVVKISCDRLRGNETKFSLPKEIGEQEFNLVEVKDNGIGFEQEDAEKIFKLFTRLHGNVEFTGTGIGLSIVRKVMENHNGYVRAESEPDQGACFQLLFPIVED